jgi:hypothetical protein
MKLLPILVLVAILAVLHLSGALYAKNAVLVQQDNDVRESQSVFDTIDLRQASGGPGFEAPRMLNPPDVIPPLLKYPPTTETLKTMCG